MRRRPQITIDVVAAEAGVSASTVSHVLNGRSATARISQATSERVRNAARRLGYTPNHAARSLRRQRTGIIAVLAWRLSSPFFADIATGVRNIAQQRGFQVGVIDAGATDREVEIRALESLRTGICDGVIVATGTHGRRGSATEALLELVEGGIPVSLVMDRSPDPSVPALDVDHMGGGYLATKHLLELGHRRIAFLGDEEANLFGFDSSAHRREGFEAALAAAGTALAPEWIMHRPHGRDAACVAASELLAHETRPTAMFATSDVQAIGVLEAAQAAGVPVPAELSVIGFDNVEAAGYTGLTTVAQPLEEIGSLGADLLLRAVSGEAVESCRMPLGIVERGSTAPPACEVSREG
jgi:DNA-binding LacI/PurR family transcriptional regulator